MAPYWKGKRDCHVASEKARGVAATNLSTLVVEMISIDTFIQYPFKGKKKKRMSLGWGVV